MASVDVIDTVDCYNVLKNVQIIQVPSDYVMTESGKINIAPGKTRKVYVCYVCFLFSSNKGITFGTAAAVGVTVWFSVIHSQVQ